MLFFLRRKRIWKNSIWTLVAIVIGLFVAHVGAMMVFDAIWLTATTIVTVGYGDNYAKTVLGRCATMGLFFFGVFTFASLVSAISTKLYERNLKKINGKWNWNMENHIIFVSPCDGEFDGFVAKVVGELRNEGVKDHIVMVNKSTEANSAAVPSSFQKLDIALVRTHGDDEDAFKRAGLAKARLVVILTDCEDIAATINFVTLIKYLGTTADIVAETVNEHENRVLAAGADRVVRPLKFYPEQLAREILAPNSAAIIENLFSAFGPTLTSKPWDGNKAMATEWADYVRFSIVTDKGTPIAIQLKDGTIHINPKGEVEDVENVFVIQG